MIPAFLITFREVIEASLIVVTILGILVKLKQQKSLKTVWFATASALVVSIVLLLAGSLVGIKVQELYTGRAEELFEGVLMLTSAIFITWAVFWLHKYFANYKLKLLQQVKSTIETQQNWGLFVLVFTAVFREGFEVVLFLSTIYLSSSPTQVLSGFGMGMGAGLVVSYLFFTAALKLPIYRAFQITTVLLILFAAGLLGRGVHEFTEAGLIPQLSSVTFAFIPAKGHLFADLLKAIFGWSQKMDTAQLFCYATYILFMRWYLYQRKSSLPQQ